MNSALTFSLLFHVTNLAKRFNFFGDRWKRAYLLTPDGPVTLLPDDKSYLIEGEMILATFQCAY